MWIVKLLLGLTFAYALLVGAVYFVQTRILFPTGLAGGATHILPMGATRETITTPDGATLVALRIAATDGAGRDRPLVLGFGGNAWNAEAVAVLLHRLLPGHDVVAAYYRGYPPSSGRPSADALLADALIVHDRFATPSGVIAVGFSIGSGIAANLAANRPLAGLVLVTPFDSLTALARHHYPWAPVGLLLRNRIETAEYLRQVRAPVAVITAEHDTVVPASRSVPVAEAARNLVFQVVIPGVGHNEIYDTADFTAAMRAAMEKIASAGHGKAGVRPAD